MITHESLELAALTRAVQELRTLVEAMKEARTPIDTPYLISSVNPYVIDYKNRKHLFIYSPVALTLTIEDYTTTTGFSLAAMTWHTLDFQPGTRVYATNIAAASPVYMYIKATDEPILLDYLTGVGSAQVGTWTVGSTSDYPAGAVPITATSGNQANATATATLAATAGKTTYITGFEVTGAGATGALVVTVTVTNTITGTLSYTYVFVAGVTLANQPLIVEFPKAIPASAANTTIVVSCPASGTGGTNNVVNAHGYQL